MKPTTAEKAAKQTAKSAPKVFDVAHPGKGTPSATSRPVIVTNRPILQDPMMSSSSESDADSPRLSPAAVKVTIKPLAETDEPAKQDKTGKEEKDKTIAELAAEKSVEKLAEAAVKGKTPAEESHGESDAEPAEESAPPDKDDAEEKEPASEDDETSKGNKDDESAETGSDTEELPVGDTKDAKEIAALEAEAKKLEAINALIDGRQYALPINAVERHRSKVVSIFGLLLIVVLGLLLVDLMLDVGFIHIKGVHALTHFFSTPA